MAKAMSMMAVMLLPIVASLAYAEAAQRVVDLPTRPGVTQRILVLPTPEAKAAVILFAGGHGGLQIAGDGKLQWGNGNFLMRTREMFADRGIYVVVVDAPSDRQREPFLSGFRQTPEHATDVKAVIGWVREQAKIPVWLVGTSRGTQSAAYVATELSDTSGPDGLVLTSSILVDDRGRAVPAMPLAKVRIPVLVVHHEQDGCRACPYAAIPDLMAKLTSSSRTKLLPINGGTSRGDPCEALAYHGFNGREGDVVAEIVNFIVAK